MSESMDTIRTLSEELASAYLKTTFQVLLPEGTINLTPNSDSVSLQKLHYVYDCNGLIILGIRFGSHGSALCAL